MELTFRGTPAQVIAVDEITQVGQARRCVQELATQAGFDEADRGRAALVVTELASNVIKHGHGGCISLSLVSGRHDLGVEIIAVDRGSGFDLSGCLPDGFSTQGTQGIGLGAVVRQTQVMDMYADSHGAVVLARLYPRQSLHDDLRFGIVQAPIHGERYCGDSCALAINDSFYSAIVVDGLGHGEAAAQAADAAIDAFMGNPFAEPTSSMGEVHQAMLGTRGGAVAIARVDLAQGALRFAGIGNISANLIAFDATRGLASHPGIVGGQFRRTQAFDFSDIMGQLLIMHSDGLQTRWRLTDYPGLSRRHPAVIAAVLHRDFCRNRDDVTVMVIALEPVHV